MPATRNTALTISGVLARVETLTSLPPKRRGELCSALKRLTELTGVDPHSTLADPATLRKLFASGKWRLEGVSARRWANIKSLVREAVTLVGVNVHRTRVNYALGPEWERLIAQLPVPVSRDLRRFAGWCTGLGITPDKVHESTFAEFLIYCTDSMTHRNPRERWHVARRAWNRVVELGLLPHGVHIACPEVLRWQALRWSDLPMSLKEDFDRYVADRTRPRVITKKGREPLRPVTIQNYDTKLRTLATCMVEAGVSADTLTSLHTLTALANLEIGLEQYARGDDLEDARPRLNAVAIAVRAIVTWLLEAGRLDEESAEEIREYCEVVDYAPTVMTAKNTRRLAQFKDPALVRLFLNLPYAVFDRMEDVKAPTVRQAQDALMAALLCTLVHAPVRISNASQISLDKNVTRMKRGSEHVWLLEWKEQQVKNKVTLRHELPACCTRLLEIYCSRFRPVLLREPRTELFLSQSGVGKCPSSLSKQLSAFIHRETGIEFNAHLIRHVMALLFLKLHPGDYPKVQRLLGHKSRETTIRFYTGLESETDHAVYDAVIAKYRDHVTGQQPWEDRL